MLVAVGASWALGAEMLGEAGGPCLNAGSPWAPPDISTTARPPWSRPSPAGTPTGCKEEKERGISIELGYAELALPSGRHLSVVDVPGHERFVKNMVAGATGIDIFLLVVAADDGVMPQTREHLRIIELSDIPVGCVALTKTDMVDEEMVELAAADVEDFLATSRYAGAPVVPVSGVTGAGLPSCWSCSTSWRAGPPSGAATRRHGSPSTGCSRSRGSARW